jgi:hypothetical protein
MQGLFTSTQLTTRLGGIGSYFLQFPSVIPFNTDNFEAEVLSPVTFWYKGRKGFSV